MRTPTRVVIVALGEEALEGLVVRHTADDSTSRLTVGGLFIFVGATPSTQWLHGQLAVDKDGFVLTGADIPVARLESVEHLPLLLETSRPGIFCVGDVRRDRRSKASSTVVAIKALQASTRAAHRRCLLHAMAS